jgi:hypothetical protein
MIFETNSLFVSNFKMASLAPQITVSFLCIPQDYLALNIGTLRRQIYLQCG